MKSLAAAAACCLALAAAPAFAADAKVEAGLATVKAISGDAARLKTYCDLNAAMAAADGETDQSKADDMDKKIADLVKALGPDFEALWALGSTVDPDSADGKALGDAMNGLDDKCAK